MNWIVLSVAMVVLGLFCLGCGIHYSKMDGKEYWAHEKNRTFSYVCAGTLLVVGIMFLFCTAPMPFAANMQINQYEQQYIYFQENIAPEDLQDVGVRAIKIELNEWLFNAQYGNATYGNWSFYPDSIQELEPIK